MKPVITTQWVHIKTKEEDSEFRQLLHDNGFVWADRRMMMCFSGWDDYPHRVYYQLYPNKQVTTQLDSSFRNSSKAMDYESFKRTFLD